MFHWICTPAWSAFSTIGGPILRCSWNPNCGRILLTETGRRKIPLALINARISSGSFAGWKRVPGLARRIFSTFDICLAQDQTVAHRLSALGARDVRIAGNLKADAPPLPVDEAALAQFRHAIGDRPVFLAASTHEGEVDAILDAVVALKSTGVLTIIVPRHADLGVKIESLAEERGYLCARRQKSALPASETQVYIADTMGELGLFYRTARAAFMGGSLIPHGGQNPLEAARLSVPVIAGPHTGNFAGVYRAVFDAQGFGRIDSAEELSLLANQLLRDGSEAKRIGELARLAAERLGGALDITVQVAERLLAHA